MDIALKNMMNTRLELTKITGVTNQSEKEKRYDPPLIYKVILIDISFSIQVQKRY